MNYKTTLISLNGVPTEVIEIPNQASAQIIRPQLISQNINPNPVYTQTVEIVPQQVYYQNQQPIQVSNAPVSNYSYYQNPNQANINYAQNYQPTYQNQNTYAQNYQPIQNPSINQNYYPNTQQQLVYNQQYSGAQSNFNSDQNKIQELRKALAESKRRGSNSLNQPMSDVLDDFDFNPSQLHEYVNSLSPLAQSKYKTLKYLLNTGNISMDEYLIKMRKIFMDDVDA